MITNRGFDMEKRKMMYDNLSEEKKQEFLDDWNVETPSDFEKALERCDDSYLIENDEDTFYLNESVSRNEKNLNRLFNSVAYSEGYDAYKDGVEPYENPYEENTEEYDEWQKGWDEADIDNYNSNVVE